MRYFMRALPLIVYLAILCPALYLPGYWFFAAVPVAIAAAFGVTTWVRRREAREA